HVDGISFGKGGMELQDVANVHVTEIHTQRSAISDNRADWFILVSPVGKPHAASPTESHLLVQLVYFVQFRISRQLLCSEIYTASRDRSDHAKGFFLRRIIRDNANSSPRGESRI